MATKLRNAISAIPPEGEWWSSSGEEEFVAAGERLLDLGMEEEEIVAFLTELYCAVAGEFGG